MNNGNVDILMVTHRRAEYTRRTLERLLQTCNDARSNVWIWHNGDDAATLEVVRSQLSHPRVSSFTHCPGNRPLSEVLNWFWQNSHAGFVCKVDDDTLVPDGWIETLRDAHRAMPTLGVAACWGFSRNDLLAHVPDFKIHSASGHRVLLNCYVPGTGHMMKRSCVKSAGPIAAGQSFARWCVHLAATGWRNGWYYPPIYVENLDDPRHPETQLRSDADLVRHRGLSATRWGVRTLSELVDRQRRLAIDVQTSPIDPHLHLGLRGRLRAVARQAGLIKSARIAST